MIVEPASVQTPSPLRRLLRAVTVVTPVALLVVFVAAGALGNGPAPRPEASLAVPATSASSGPADAAIPPPNLIATADADFPATYLSMRTMAPSEVLAARASADGPPALLAVKGFLDVFEPPVRCLVKGDASGSWCDRRGILAEVPFVSLGDGLGPPAHLHLIVPAGVVLPSSVGGTAGAFVPVVVLGRFAGPGSCGADEQACEQGFVVERVAWASGDGTSLEALREPGQGLGITTAALGHAETSGLPMLVVLARASTIALLDPAAGAAAARLSGHPSLLWYEREVLWVGSSPAVGWLLIDPHRGRAAASGPSALPPVVVATEPPIPVSQP